MKNTISLSNFRKTGFSLYLASVISLCMMVFYLFNNRVCGQSVSMTVVVTDATCNEADGTLEVTINNAVTPVWFNVIFNNAPLSGFPTNGTTTYFYIQNLMSGIYTLRVKAANSDTITEYHEISETDDLWPVLARNDIRAVAVDLMVDNLLNVVSCGYWNGFINFDSPQYDNAWDMNSSGETDVYLVKHDACGKIIWSVQIMPLDEFDNCLVNAVFTDINNDVIACGTFSGNIQFPGNNNITLSADPNKPGSAWVAKFDETTGDCLWAVLFSSEHGVQAKDVCAYADGNIFIAGDFLGDDIDLFDVTNNSPHTLYNTDNSDAFIAAYDEDGYYLDSDLLASTSADDVAGGLCCFESNQGTSIAEIIVTGVKNGDYWLGQRWYHDPMTGLAIITDFNLYSGGTPIDQYKVGMTVEPYILNAQQSFVFAGYVIDNNATFPWVASAITPSSVQSTQSTADYLEFIGANNAYNFNIANAITINQPASGASPSLFFGGIANDDAYHPTGTPNINVPANQYGDFFVDKFGVNTGGIDDIFWAVYSNTGTSNYGQDPLSTPYYLGLGCDHSGRIFLTASYLDNINTGFGLTVQSTGASGVFIGRIMETTTGGGWFKNLVAPENITGSTPSFSFFPNPATGEICLQLPAKTRMINFSGIDGRLFIPTRNSFAKKRVIAVYGITQSKQFCIRKPVKTEYKSIAVIQPSDWQLQLNTSFLKPGAYIIQVCTEEGNFTRKLIRQ